MEHAALVNNSYIENISARYLGTHLKHQGVKVSVIHYAGSQDKAFDLLPEESLIKLADFCRQCDLVGISLLTTHQLERSSQIHDYLKDRNEAPRSKLRGIKTEYILSPPPNPLSKEREFVVTL